LWLVGGFVRELIEQLPDVGLDPTLDSLALLEPKIPIQVAVTDRPVGG